MSFNKRSRNYSSYLGTIRYTFNDLLKYNPTIFRTEYKKMKSYSRINQNKTLNNFANEIKNVSANMRISDEEFNSILFSELNTGNEYEYTNN